MILSTVSVGFQVSNIEIDEPIKNEMFENIKSEIPEEVHILGLNLDKYDDDINQVVVLTVNSAFESGTTLKLTRDAYEEEIRNSVTKELIELMNSKGVIYQQLSTD